MAKRKEEEPPAGAPAWMATFSDLMNLLLCFFVLLFSMSSVDAAKYDQLVSSMQQNISFFTGGASAIGDGILISNGVSQLNELDQYINSTGKAAESDSEEDLLKEYNASSENQSELEKIAEVVEQQNLKANEELAEKIAEAIAESNMSELIEVSFNSQFVMLSLRGALLFDSGKADIKEECLAILSKVGSILEKYAEHTIDVEGHTDNVPISGRYADNEELSNARALSIFYYLVENTALDPAAIKHSGRGDRVPVADNATEAGRAKNRRVEIRIYRSPQ